MYEVDGPNGSAINVRQLIYDSDYPIHKDAFYSNIMIIYYNILNILKFFRMEIRPWSV